MAQDGAASLYPTLGAGYRVGVRSEWYVTFISIVDADIFPQVLCSAQGRIPGGRTPLAGTTGVA